MNHAARILATLLLLCSPLAIAETATLARDTELRAQALGNAPVVAALKARTLLTVNSRKGAWAQVTTADGKTGHVRLLNLRSTTTRQGDSGIGALTSVFRTGSSGNSVATGVKGMSAEDLTTAEANIAELKELDGYRAGKKEARSAAATTGLKAHDVEFLPPPAKR